MSTPRDIHGGQRAPEFRPVALLLLLACAACQTEVVETTPDTPKISAGRRLALESTVEWVRTHSCRLVADSVRVVLPLELRQETALRDNMVFFERRDRAEPSAVGLPALRRTVFQMRPEIQNTSTPDLTQVPTLVLGGIELAALRRLEVRFDPRVGDLAIDAQGEVAWKLDDEAPRREERAAFHLPPVPR